MSGHEEMATLLPFYAAGTLDERERRAVEEHLAGCAECRGALALWLEVGPAVNAANAALPEPSPAVLSRVVAATRQRHRDPFTVAWQLLLAQARLLRRDLWLASALVMSIGYVVAMLMGSEGRSASIIEAIAPLIAMAGVAVIYGPDNDPSLEMALATPTSPRQVLLARLVLVFGYDLALALIATLGLLPLVSPDLMGGIVLNWLGPMTFLSALSLVLSLCIGTSGAVTVAALLWLARMMARGVMVPDLLAPELQAPAAALAAQFQAGWGNPLLMIGMAAVLVAASLWIVGRQEPYLGQGARMG